MDYNRNRPRNIPDEEREAFKEALTIYYSGGARIADAFGQVEPGLIDRYYRRKKKCPDEIESIEDEAHRLALKNTEQAVIAHESSKFAISREIVQEAAAVQQRGVHMLAQIIDMEPGRTGMART